MHQQSVLIMDDEPETPPFEPPLVALTQDEEPHAQAPSLAQARLLVLAAAILWSSSGFFVKAPYFFGWSGPVLAFWRAVFACLALWPLVRQPRWSWQLVPMTLMFAAGAMNLLWMAALGLVMILEKTMARPQRLVQMVGAALVLLSLVQLGLEFFA